MTFLPIVERELRVAARRRGTYWTRSGLALGATVVGVASFVASLISPGVKFGQVLFWGLSGMAMLYCLSAGRLLTADCLSEEKREGTLGLLFLTDLKGYDVVLGKLAANSLDGFYGLLAAVPVLAMTLLLGGTTYAEFGRMVLVLVNTFFFTLAIGIVVSAFAREYREAAGRYLFIVLTAIILPPAALAAWTSTHPSAGPAAIYWLVPCPVAPFFLTSDARYHGANGLTTAAAAFWWSTGLIHLFGWVLVLVACWIAPRSWQDKSSPLPGQAGTGRRRWQWWRESGPEMRTAFRIRLLDQNAYYWLAARPCVKPAWVWTFLALVGLWCLRIALNLGWFDEVLCVATALLVNCTLKLWIALEAGQQLAEDRKTGAFELLLCTPIQVRAILRGQLAALRRQFFGPLLAVAAVEAVFMLFLMRPNHRTGSNNPREVVCTWTAGIVMLAGDAVALSCVGMAAALTAKSHARAMLAAIGKVLMLPWILYFIVIALTKLWMDLVSPLPWDWSPSWRYEVGWWFGLGIFIDVALGWRAWNRLQNHFRPLALAAFSPQPLRRGRFWRRRARPATDAVWTPAVASQGRPRRKKLKPAIIFLGAVLICAGAWFMRPSPKKTPLAPVVFISRTNTALRVLPAPEGILFVLPDGSHWRWGKLFNESRPRAAIPEPLGWNFDWTDVALGYGNLVGLRADGTLWQWRPQDAEPRTLWEGHRLGWTSNGQWGPEDPEPKTMDRDPGRIRVSAGGGHAVLLKQDGTLWAWGDNRWGQLGNGPNLTNGPYQSAIPAQIGTNCDWKAVQCWDAFTAAVRRNGTLWIWGYVPISTVPGSMRSTNCDFPVQVCQETNWAALSRLGAQNEAGELWRLPLLQAFPSATAPVSNICILSASDVTSPVAVMGRFGMGGSSALYQVRTNGTLWAKPLVWQPRQWWLTPSAAPWERVGKRTDWTAVWGWAGTVVALTADGTLWTWGLDFGQEPSLSFPARVQALKASLADKLGAPGTGTPSPEYPLQTEPRALLRLAPGK